MFAFIALIIVNTYTLINTGNPPVTQDGEKGWTIYVTMGCGWTRKQLDHMKNVNKPFTFIDCDKENCDGMDAFPTLISPSGEKYVGYKEV